MGGPLAHQRARPSASGTLSDDDLRNIVAAMRGYRTARKSGPTQDMEILSLIALDTLEHPSRDQVLGNLEDAVARRQTAPTVPRQDRLAETITKDFLEICALEKRVPRREWLYFLLSFLRISTPMWLLGHLAISVKVRNWVLAAAEKRGVPTQREMNSALDDRHVGLLHPTTSPTREVVEHIEGFMRARVELRLLVREISLRAADTFKDSRGKNKLLALDSGGADVLPLERLLRCARDLDWAEVTMGMPVRQWLTRQAEQWPAWSSPLRIGQGKHVREFFRVLHYHKDDDTGSSLLVPTRGGQTAKISPEHRLLQMFAFLAERRKVRAQANRRGRLVLRDVEAHLMAYGIDCKSGAVGRSVLVAKLSDGGLFRGSPDAGESAQVLNILPTA